MNSIETVREFYNNSVEHEWERLNRHPFEFAVTKAYLDKYIKPGDKVLDIGGGPGRYSLYLAEKGCDVTLFDLSEQNVAFALSKAKEHGLTLAGVSGDARYAEALVSGEFDHVLLMGPLYHLLEEKDRAQSVKSALKLLKPNGMLFVSFLSLYSGISYAMKYEPSLVLCQSESDYLRCYLENQTFCGDGFTKACSTAPHTILPFMEQFNLQKLHLFGQEGITSPCEDKLREQPKEIFDAWVKLAISTCEREEFLAFSEHVMYIGRKL